MKLENGVNNCPRRCGRLPPLVLTSVSPGGPRLFGHARAPDDGSAGRPEGIHAAGGGAGAGAGGGAGGVAGAGRGWPVESSGGERAADQTADGEEGPVVPSSAVRKYGDLRGRHTCTSPADA